MATAPLLLALALAVQVPAPAAARAPAKPFVSEAGGFRIDLPGDPVEQVKTADSPLGPLEFHIFAVTHGGATYAASYNDMPEVLALADPDRALEGGVEGALKNTRGKLLIKRNIAIDGHPGKEFTSHVPGLPGTTHCNRARLYLVRTRLYQVVLAGTEEQVSGEAGERIFKSFALLNPPPAPVPVKPLAAGKSFTSEAGRYRVRFPQAPREVVQKVPSPVGPIEVHMAVLDRGDVAFFASYNDYQFDPAAFDIDAALEGIVQGSMEGSKATLRSKKDIALGKHPGKAYEAALKLPDGRPATCRARIYMVEKRLYQVLVVEARGKEDPKATAAYLDSFALLKPPTP
jgi:hypothetical protein